MSVVLLQHVSQTLAKNLISWSVAPELASTKSGGRAPPMAHRHDVDILKRSASYFYKKRRISRMRTCLLSYSMDRLSREKEEEGE
ncbi:hypothetical protein EYF80_029152 [Liparis tanakae]|uniref:Uncharacterized protein n=1 Tax=Liparis tanakae TaxID=230148 RepID=A0A4Z2H4J3_9TELE|nr:hypothetical protein EYF80_029152 [Liparis tanakae]